MQTTAPTYPMDTPDVDPEVNDQQWMDAVTTAAGRAYDRLPHHTEMIKAGFLLIAEGKVQALMAGGFQVATGLKRGKKYWVVDGTCECPDWHDTPDGICVHKMATMLWTRARQLLDQYTATQQDPPPAGPPAPAPQPPPAATPVPSIPAHYLVEIQGKQFVRYIGLLALAHAQGLVSLAVEWTGNDPELSLAHAVALFNDGRKFEESGDAAPDNVGTRIKPHFRRMALTRAKARVLRDALGIDLVAVEELAD